MASVHIQEDFYVPSVDIVVDTPRDILDIMDNNSITPVEILEDLEWGLPDLQEAARQLDLEYRPTASTGADLHVLFRRLEPVEQREFMYYITDALVRYHRSTPDGLPSELL